MGAATAERKTVAEMRAAKAEREKAEAEKGQGREAIDAAHAALGTGQDVPGSEHFDDGPQDVHGGDGLDEGGGESRETPSGQFTFAVGGKRPTATGLRLVGGKIDVEGSFSKGETIEIRVVAVVGEVAFIDQVDAKTSQIVGCERRHKARIKSVTVL